MGNLYVTCEKNEVYVHTSNVVNETNLMLQIRCAMETVYEDLSLHYEERGALLGLYMGPPKRGWFPGSLVKEKA